MMGRVEQNYLGLGRQVRNSDTLLPRGYKCLVFSCTLAVARCYFKIQNWCISDNQRLCWSSWGHTSSMIWSSYLSLPINASLSLSLSCINCFPFTHSLQWHFHHCIFIFRSASICQHPSSTHSATGSPFSHGLGVCQQDTSSHQL